MDNLLLMEAVEQRKKYLHHRLWKLGEKDLTGNETLAELERMYIKAMYDKGNPKQ